jgi:hypothetical protein
MLQHENEIVKFRIETCQKNLRQNNEKGIMVAHENEIIKLV